MSQETSRRRTSQRPAIKPDRVRRISEGGFAFFPNRFLQEGFFASLSADELRLYVLLVLAGNREGMSYYSYDRLCSLLELPLECYLAARNALIAKDLIAFDGTRFQVLSLPSSPRFDPRPAFETQECIDEHDPATVRRRILSSLRRPLEP